MLRNTEENETHCSQFGKTLQKSKHMKIFSQCTNYMFRCWFWRRRGFSGRGKSFPSTGGLTRIPVPFLRNLTANMLADPSCFFLFCASEISEPSRLGSPPLRLRLTFQIPQSPAQALIPCIVDTATHTLSMLHFCFNWPSSLEAGFGEEKHWLPLEPAQLVSILNLYLLSGDKNKRHSRSGVHWDLSLKPHPVPRKGSITEINPNLSCTHFSQRQISPSLLTSYFSKLHLDNRTRSVWGRKRKNWSRQRIKTTS